MGLKLEHYSGQKVQFWWQRINCADYKIQQDRGLFYATIHDLEKASIPVSCNICFI